MVETDDGSQSVNKLFTNLLNNINNKRYSRHTSFSLFPQNASIVLLEFSFKNLFFKKVMLNGLSHYSQLPKEYMKKNNCFINLTPTQASSKENEGHVHQKCKRRTIEKKPKIKFHELAPTAGLKKTFPKEDSTNSSNKL